MNLLLLLVSLAAPLAPGPNVDRQRTRTIEEDLPRAGTVRLYLLHADLEPDEPARRPVAGPRWERPEASPLPFAAPSREIEDGSALTTTELGWQGTRGWLSAALDGEVAYAAGVAPERAGEERGARLASRVRCDAPYVNGALYVEGALIARSFEAAASASPVAAARVEAGARASLGPLAAALGAWALDGATEGALLDDAPGDPARESRWLGADARARLALGGGWRLAADATLSRTEAEDDALVGLATSSIAAGVSWSGGPATLGVGARRLGGAPGVTNADFVDAVASLALSSGVTLSLEGRNLTNRDPGDAAAAFPSRWADGLVGGDDDQPLGLYAEGGAALLVRLTVSF